MLTYHDENQDDGSRLRSCDAIYDCDPGLAAGVDQIGTDVADGKHEGDGHNKSEYICELGQHKPILSRTLKRLNAYS